MKRRHGFGSVSVLADGRRWVRGSRDAQGRRPTLGYVATDAEAEALLALRSQTTYRQVGGKTFEKVAEDVLDQRELDGIRGVAEERSVFKAHLATACFAQKPIEDVAPTDVARWLREMTAKKAKGTTHPLSRGTVQRALALASAVFVAAGPQGFGLVASNPCAGMRVRTKESKTEEPWTFLTLAEQERIRDSRTIHDADRFAILFALGTGLRQGEQFNLELRDVHVTGEHPHVVVRFGSKAKAPKNGKIREVPLFGLALAATNAWLRLLPSFCPRNPEGLLFPTRTGSRRASSKPLGNGRFLPRKGGTHRYTADGALVRVAKGQGTHVYVDRFDLVLEAAGITRQVRWHDLRHTCASSLLSGFWGEPWTMAEVKEMLGHSAVAVTERYAHLAETALKNATRKIGGGLVGGGRGAGIPVASISCDIKGVEQRGIEPLTSALRTRTLVELLRGLSSESTHENPTATHLAAALLNVLERGQA